MDQSPDSILVDNNNIKILEVTISQGRLAKHEKMSKYSLLIHVLESCGFLVDVEIIVISSNELGVDRVSLKSDHGFDDELIDEIYNVVKTINAIISQVEADSLGQIWSLQRSKLIHTEITSFNITNEQILNYYDRSSTKVFHDVEQLKEILEFDDDELNYDINNDQNIFIESVVDQVFKYSPDLLKNQDLHSNINELKTFHNKNSNWDNRFRHFLPLPYLDGFIQDSSERSTDEDHIKLCEIKQRLSDSGDEFLSVLSSINTNIGDLKLPANLKANIALQGPGRKKFVTKRSFAHLESQKKNKNYWFDPWSNNYQEDIISLLKHFSKHTIDEKYDKKSLPHAENIESPGLSYVRCCQSIFREITLNSLRDERRDNFIIKPTGVRGVFICIHPGPKLRTGENLSQVWYKLITTENFPSNHIASHWAFKSWNLSNTVYHSNWLSIDANRLDHYLRSYDRIIMSYLSYVHYGKGHLINNIKEDDSDVLGLIILIYMENKRSTSKMLQDVRYLVMGSLSIKQYWGDLIKKYKEPVRTPLQGYLLTKIIDFSIDMNNNLSKYLRNVKFGKVRKEVMFDVISDKFAGSLIELPRPLSTGSVVPFQQVLCEMYFCMLFNKNQDDPTHSTFQILNKMLEGENTLNKLKRDGNKYYMGARGVSESLDLISNPSTHQFSITAIEIGSKLQAKSVYNKSPGGLSHKKASQNMFLNKPLSDYATYKSSSTPHTDVKIEYTHSIRLSANEPDKFSDKLEKIYYDDTELYDQDELLEEDSIESKSKKSKFKRKINPRRRCIEGVIDLLKRGHFRAFDVVETTIEQDLYFQVFKKNQIGGVREILILPIDKRITINILESFSRLICKDDEREMLTHGDAKLTLMRDMIRNLKRKAQRSLIVNYNLDKTRWGPSFMPIQFLYMFTPFRREYPKLFRFILMTLMSHSNKKCLIPEKLIDIWNRDKLNKKIHNEPLLQQLKVEYLKTGKLYFNNESNMGQGILHYTSSYLHLCMVSFRDELYLRSCKRLSIEPGDWRDIISSDDSYTAQSLLMEEKNKKTAKVNVILFIKCQEISELLFNMRTSKSKSSISPLVSEFNSMFGSHLTLFPTLFKFALSSVNPLNTDSFFRMVKEYYTLSRQIVENGGSLELYLVSQRLNKKYCESIYHTYEGGANDLRKFDLNPQNTPYQLGSYPIGDPGVMIIIGPEFHNYRIMKNIDNLTEKELHLFRVCHKMIKLTHPEAYADLSGIESLFTGLLRIEACLGPVGQLLRIKRQIDMSWEEMNKMIMDDFLLLFRRPETLAEVKLLTYLKLFSFGSSEALRTTASCLYYARVSASVTANAYKIPYVNFKSPNEGHEEVKNKLLVDKKEKKSDRKVKKKYNKHTYIECLKHLLDQTPPEYDIKTYYPYMKEYESLSTLSYAEINYNLRDKLESQNLRNLQLSEVTMRVKHPIKDLLDVFWNNKIIEPPTSMTRDWITLKEMMPIIQNNKQQTIDSLSGDNEQKIRHFISILLKIMALKEKPMKTVIFGPSSNSYDQSYLTLVQQNMYHRYTSFESISVDSINYNSSYYDKLFYIANLYFLSMYHGWEFDAINYIEDSIVQAFMRDNYFSVNTKKKNGDDVAMLWVSV